MDKQITVYLRTIECETEDNGAKRSVMREFPFFNNMKFIHFPGDGFSRSVFKEMMAPNGILYKHHKSIVMKNYKAEQYHKECYDKIMIRNGLPIRCPAPELNLISNGKPMKDAGSFCFMTYLFGHYGFRLIYNTPGSDYWTETFDLSGLITDKGTFSEYHYASEYSLSMMANFIDGVREGRIKGEESWKAPQPK